MAYGNIKGNIAESSGEDGGPMSEDRRLDVVRLHRGYPPDVVLQAIDAADLLRLALDPDVSEWPSLHDFTDGERVGFLYALDALRLLVGLPVAWSDPEDEKPRPVYRRDRA
jgi:hypothetical protein